MCARARARVSFLKRGTRSYIQTRIESRENDVVRASSLPRRSSRSRLKKKCLLISSFVTRILSAQIANFTYNTIYNTYGKVNAINVQ